MNRFAAIGLAIAGSVVLAGIVGLGVKQSADNRMDREKAARYDEICRSVKASLETDARVLSGQDDSFRAFVASRYDNESIGERVRLIDWCTDGPAFNLRELAMCRDRGDLACVATMLADAAGKVTQ